MSNCREQAISPTEIFSRVVRQSPSIRAAQWDPTHRKVRDEWGTRPKWPVREICLAYPYCVLIHFTDAEELPA